MNNVDFFYFRFFAHEMKENINQDHQTFLKSFANHLFRVSNSASGSYCKSSAHDNTTICKGSVDIKTCFVNDFFPESEK